MSIHIVQPGGPPQEVELGSALPKVLPVLPLKDSVPFPETLTPLMDFATHEPPRDGWYSSVKSPVAGRVKVRAPSSWWPQDSRRRASA